MIYTENILGNYTVFYNGDKCGNLTVTQDGLMTVFSCICDMTSSDILRLYCISGESTVPIGVMTPCQKNLTLCKVFSKNALVSLGIGKIDKALLSQSAPRYDNIPKEKPAPSPIDGWQHDSEPWRHFRDEIAISSCRSIKGALTRTENGAVYLAVPISPDEPFPPMPIFCFGTFQVIGGGDYMVFTIKDGKFI